MEKVRIFLDTNIVLDFFTNRMGDGLAAKVVQVGQSGQYELCISFLTAVNVIYVAKRMNYLMKPEVISRFFTILPNDAQQWEDASTLEMNDFEDALQTSCALRNGCLFVVTRDRHFEKAPMVYFSPEDFLNAVVDK